MCANTTLYHFNLKVEAQGKQIAFLGSLSFKEVVFHQLCGPPMLGKLIPHAGEADPAGSLACLWPIPAAVLLQQPRCQPQPPAVVADFSGGQV